MKCFFPLDQGECFGGHRISKTLVGTLCLGVEFTIQSSLCIFFPAFHLPAPPLRIQLSIPNIQAARLQRGLPCRHLKYRKLLSKL